MLMFFLEFNYQSDGWDTEPFVLTEKDGKLYGRGSTDDKGPVLGWLHAIKAFHATKTEIPINLKVNKSFIFPILVNILIFFSVLLFNCNIY